MKLLNAVPALALALCGCASTAELNRSAPDRIYRSADAPEAVAECLLDRVSSPDLRPERSAAGETITIAFTSADAIIRPRPAIYLFKIRSADSGSVVETRRLGKAKLATAETCFEPMAR